MNFNAPWRLLALAGLGPLLACPALAQDAYSYIGGSVGQSRSRIDEGRITSTLLGGGLSTTQTSRDPRDTGYKLFLGYQMNRYLGVEAGLFDLGRFGFSSTTAPAGTLDGRIKVQGLNLDLVGTLPISENLSLLGRVGAQSARVRDTFSGTGAVHVLTPELTRRSTNLKAGLGLQYAFSPSLLVRAEAEHYRIHDAVDRRGAVNLYSVGLVFPFGRTTTTAPRAAAPAYVAPAPAPAPVPVPMAAAPPPAPMPAPVVAAAPAPPPRQRVSFSAESLFAFDQSTLKPEGTAALDGFARQLAGTQFDTIRVEGHTDRLGSDAYNQRLSMRRADAVKSYLVGTARLDGAKITALGKGKSSPVTKPEDCKGAKPSPKLIACLQPDRRVDVEVSGMR